LIAQYAQHSTEKMVLLKYLFKNLAKYRSENNLLLKYQTFFAAFCASCLSFLYNYFDNLTKIFSDLEIDYVFLEQNANFKSE